MSLVITEALDCGSPAAAFREAALLRAAFRSPTSRSREKPYSFYRTSNNKEPDSRAVSAKAAAGLPQSKVASAHQFLPKKITSDKKLPSLTAYNQESHRSKSGSASLR
jgi:hypothetical protein